MSWSLLKKLSEQFAPGAQKKVEGLGEETYPGSGMLKAGPSQQERTGKAFTEVSTADPSVSRWLEGRGVADLPTYESHVGVPVGVPGAQVLSDNRKTFRSLGEVGEAISDRALGTLQTAVGVPAGLYGYGRDVINEGPVDATKRLLGADNVDYGTVLEDDVKPTDKSFMASVGEAVKNVPGEIYQMGAGVLGLMDRATTPTYGSPREELKALGSGFVAGAADRLYSTAEGANAMVRDTAKSVVETVRHPQTTFERTPVTAFANASIAGGLARKAAAAGVQKIASKGAASEAAALAQADARVEALKQARDAAEQALAVSDDASRPFAENTVRHTQGDLDKGVLARNALEDKQLGMFSWRSIGSTADTTKALEAQRAGTITSRVDAQLALDEAEAALPKAKAAYDEAAQRAEAASTAVWNAERALRDAEKQAPGSKTVAKRQAELEASRSQFEAAKVAAAQAEEAAAAATAARAQAEAALSKAIEETKAAGRARAADPTAPPIAPKIQAQTAKVQELRAAREAEQAAMSGAAEQQTLLESLAQQRARTTQSLDTASQRAQEFAQKAKGGELAAAKANAIAPVGARDALYQEVKQASAAKRAAAKALDKAPTTAEIARLDRMIAADKNAQAVKHILGRSLEHVATMGTTLVYDVISEAMRRAYRDNPASASKYFRRWLYTARDGRLPSEFIAIERERQGASRASQIQIQRELAAIPKDALPTVRQVLMREADRSPLSGMGGKLVKWDEATQSYVPDPAISKNISGTGKRPQFLLESTKYQDEIWAAQAKVLAATDAQQLAAAYGELDGVLDKASKIVDDTVAATVEVANRYARPLMQESQALVAEAKALGIEVPDLFGGAYMPAVAKEVPRNPIAKAKNWLMGERPNLRDTVTKKELASIPPLERAAKYGEVDDLATQVYEGMAKLRATVETAKLYRDIAKDRSLVMTPEQFEVYRATTREAAYGIENARRTQALGQRLSPNEVVAQSRSVTEKMRAQPPAPDFKLIPADMKGTFGDLAGKYVQGDVWMEVMNHQAIMEAAQGMVGEAMRYWKGFKTAYSPSSHAHNIMTSALLMAPMAGISLLNPRNAPYYAGATADLLGLSNAAGAKGLKAGAGKVFRGERSAVAKMAVEDGVLANGWDAEMGVNEAFAREMAGAFANSMEPFVALARIAYDWRDVGKVRRSQFIEGRRAAPALPAGDSGTSRSLNRLGMDSMLAPTAAERAIYRPAQEALFSDVVATTRKEMASLARRDRHRAVAKNATDAAKSILKWPGKLYSAEDSWFRLALYRKELAKAMAKEGVEDITKVSKAARMKAAEKASKAFVDYGNIPGIGHLMRAPVSPYTGNGMKRMGPGTFYLLSQPFISYPLRAIPLFADFLQRAPITARLHLALGNYLTDLNYAHSGMNREQSQAVLDAARQANKVPVQDVGPTVAGQDERAALKGLYGQDNAQGVEGVDVSTLNPLGRFVPKRDSGTSEGPVQDVLNFMDDTGLVAAPWYNALVYAIPKNENDFTGKPIAVGPDPVQNLEDIGKYVGEQFLPPITPIVGRQARTYEDALEGKPDERTGVVREPAAVLQEIVTGVKRGVYDPDKVAFKAINNLGYSVNGDDSGVLAAVRRQTGLARAYEELDAEDKERFAESYVLQVRPNLQSLLSMIERFPRTEGANLAEMWLQTAIDVEDPLEAYDTINEMFGFFRKLVGDETTQQRRAHDAAMPRE